MADSMGPPEAGRNRCIRTREEEEAEGITSPQRVLIIDDDSPSRAMIRMALETEGYAVLEATTGFRLIGSLQVDHPGLVLLSADLSWTGSEDLCRLIKTSPDLRDIPVVFLTIEQEEETLERLSAAGCDGWIPKPVDLGDLLRFVRMLAGPPNPASPRKNARKPVGGMGREAVRKRPG